MRGEPGGYLFSAQRPGPVPCRLPGGWRPGGACAMVAGPPFPRPARVVDRARRLAGLPPRPAADAPVPLPSGGVAAAAALVVRLRSRPAAGWALRPAARPAGAALAAAARRRADRRRRAGLRPAAAVALPAAPQRRRRPRRARPQRDRGARHRGLRRGAAACPPLPAALRAGTRDGGVHPRAGRLEGGLPQPSPGVQRGRLGGPRL
jgi:hypothetical protein